MQKILNTIGVCLLLVIIGASAGIYGTFRWYTKPAINKYNAVAEQLTNTQRSLNGYREQCASLTTRLGSYEAIVTSVSNTTATAIAGLERIKDANKRIIYLVGLIRELIKQLGPYIDQAPTIATN